MTIFLIIQFIIWTILIIIKSTLDYIRNDEKYTLEYIQKYTSILVGYANQAIVSEIKKDMPDGQLTNDMKDRIYNLVSSILYRVLNNKEKKLLSKRFGSLDLGCRDIIENEINKIHMEKNRIIDENKISVSKTGTKNNQKYNTSETDVSDIIKNLLNSVNPK